MMTRRWFRDKARVSRYLLRGMIGAGMVALGITLTLDAPIAAYVVSHVPFFFPSIDMLRGGLFLGGVALWFAPVHAPVLIYWITSPLLIYSIGGAVGGVLNIFQDWTGIFYFIFAGMLILLYWRDS